jgi:hypothetical protein
VAAAEAETFPRRGQHADVGAALRDGSGHVGDAIDDVLAVVEEEEGSAGL